MLKSVSDSNAICAYIVVFSSLQCTFEACLYGFFINRGSTFSIIMFASACCLLLRAWCVMRTPFAVISLYFFFLVYSAFHFVFIIFSTFSRTSLLFFCAVVALIFFLLLVVVFMFLFSVCAIRIYPSHYIYYMIHSRYSYVSGTSLLVFIPFYTHFLTQSLFSLCFYISHFTDFQLVEWVDLVASM